jgi:hypothetical protein
VARDMKSLGRRMTWRMRSGLVVVLQCIHCEDETGETRSLEELAGRFLEGEQDVSVYRSLDRGCSSR